jgi:hypothetical protein
MYPTPLIAHAIAKEPTLIDRAWDTLNDITPEQLLGEARVSLSPVRFVAIGMKKIARFVHPIDPANSLQAEEVRRPYG